MSSSDNPFPEWDQRLEDKSSDKNQLQKEMKEFLQKNESNGQVLYRLAKVNMQLSISAEKEGTEKDKTWMKIYARIAYYNAEKGCKVEPSNPECHKWLCAALGRIMKFSPTKEKIRFGLQFKEHADIVLRLQPYGVFMQNLYGQWCYSIASLTEEEKIIVENVPNAEYDWALNAFKKVHELDSQSKENHLWIAKVLIGQNKTLEAKQWIKNGLTLKNKTILDEISQKELQELDTKYK